jgi:hypothetical protein
MNCGIDKNSCGTCSNLSSKENASQKYGWEEGNTYLPSEFDKLVLVKNLRPYGSRKLQILQCLECNAYYLYRTDYEYLVNGSEDEEFLSRMTDDEVRNYLLEL